MAAVKNHSGERKYPIISLEKPYQWDPFAAIVSEHRAEMRAKLAEARNRKKDFWPRLRRIFSFRRR